MQTKKSIGIWLMTIAMLSIGSCASSRKTIQETTSPTDEIKGPSVAALPQAVVYRTNGDYNNLVPVTLNDEGTALLSFPDPRDVATGNVTPIVLDNGYLLDRRGVNPNTAYLDYTYDEFAALESAPSVKELMNHIIAKNAITELYCLPIKASEAINNPALCNEYIANGFKDCTKVK